MTLARRLNDLESLAQWSPSGSDTFTPLAPIPIGSPADVVTLLAEQINAVRADPAADPMERAKVVGFLAGVTLRAMEAGEVQARLEAVERVLKLRRDQQREQERKR